MNLNEWLVANKPNFGSDYEILFAENVLPLVAALSLDSIAVQYPFQDMDKKQRYCDFVIRENDDVRIAIEIDGYDKRGTGTGMSHSDFIDWQRRQSALTSQGWYVLRFANRDVRDNPQRCAEHISLLLKRSRGKSSHKELSTEETKRLNALNNEQIKTISDLGEEIKRLEALAEEQSQKIVGQKKDIDPMKHAITAFTAVIFALVILIVWLMSGGFSPGQHTVASQSASPAPQPAMISEPSTVAVYKQPPVVQTPADAACNNPIPWQQARANIGRTVAVVGPLMKVTTPNTVQGNPTWIDIGGVFPSTQRLSVIIWGDKKNEFPSVSSGQLVGRSVCIIGLIESYKGNPQIVMTTASQFNVF